MRLRIRQAVLQALRSKPARTRSTSSLVGGFLTTSASGLDQIFRGLVQRLVFVQAARQRDQAGIVQRARAHVGRFRHLRVHQRLAQAPFVAAATTAAAATASATAAAPPFMTPASTCSAAESGWPAAGAVVRDDHFLALRRRAAVPRSARHPAAAPRCRSGSSLRGGPRDLAHGIGHELQRLRFVQPPGDHQHGVIGLVILVIESRQAAPPARAR